LHFANRRAINLALASRANISSSFSFQGRCNREKPPCKYFHPPQHLKDQLLINGRNHLALKNALMQQMGMAPNGQPIITSQLQPMVSSHVRFLILRQISAKSELR
jgi:uncharacterized Zn-finger protein